MSFEFAQSFYFQFRASRYTTGLKKSYYGLNLVGASIFNLEHLDILRDSIGHPTKKLLSFEFAQTLCFQFRVSRYITGLNQTSE